MAESFRGINSMTIDAKGRLAIPTRYRQALMSEDKSALVVTIDTESPCLLLYTASRWKIIEESLQKLPSYNQAARRIQRLLIGHATDLEMDASGRILLPPALRAYAHLEVDAVMIGQGNKFELWDKTLWETKREQWLQEESLQSGRVPEELKEISL